MELKISNFAKIKEANIKLDGITVIAGENDTGKSTVGRALFAVFNGFTNIQTQIDKEREDSIALLMIRMAFSANLTPSELTGMNKLARDIVVEADQYKENNEKLERRLWDFLIRQIGDKIRNFDDTLIQETVGRIIDILNIKNEDFVNTVLGKRLKAEFYGQVCNVFSETPGSVSLKIKNSGIMVTVTPNGEVQVQNPNMLSLHTEIVYLDDPFILDDSKQFSYIYDPAYLDHRDHLRRKFFITERRGNLADEIIAKEKLERIYEKIASVCSGAIVKEKTSEIGYRVGRSDKVLNVRNLSTGLKTFVILKTLLMNGTIEQNGTIILDEPEIIRQGNKYGVKIHSQAPSIHLIRANIETEIAPIVGNEQQAEDLIQYIKNEEKMEGGIWKTSIFGKTVEELVMDGLKNKMAVINEESQEKLQDSMQKIVNDSNGGMVCIII